MRPVVHPAAPPGARRIERPGPPSPSPRRRPWRGGLHAFAGGLVGIALALPAAAPARADEPPLRAGLDCRLAKHELSGPLRLEVVFGNATGTPITLPPVVHLVLYPDAAATEAMDATARLDRLQRTPLVVPAEGRTTSLFVADEARTEALLCNGTRPAAAALHFYEFSRRPTFRCLLQGGTLAALPMKSACPPAAALPQLR